MATYLLLLLLARLSAGMIGYDCGSRMMNVTTLSLIEVGECNLPKENVTVSQRYIQLLQINDYAETNVIQCKLEVHRTIYYCGMSSHVSIVKNGEAEYIYEISQHTCDEAHKTGVLNFGDAHLIQGLRVNHTITHGMTFAGYLNSDGRCNGASFSDPYGTWESVVVQGTLKITLASYTAQVKLNNDQVHLRSGTVCPLSEGTCLDIEGGHTFWRPTPDDSCNFQKYGILYEGYANKMLDYQVTSLQTVYSLTTDQITFALAIKNKETVCGYTIIRTEHPKLVIFETTKGESFAQNKKVSVSNLDIFAYVNSKFVYVEKHIRTQIKQLYRDVLKQRCSLERQTLKNALSIATQAPDEFAYNLMRGPGYMAVLGGEVVHIIKCIPVEVKVQHGENCYAELQVTHQNMTMFLTPRTHILKGKGTKITCNALLPSYYYVGSMWYKILPRPTETIPPTVMNPLTKPTWKYTSPSELATNGIYSDQDINELRERIMFPVERPALLNELAREMHGHPVTDQEGSLMKLLNEDSVAKLAESTWNHIWSQFMTFGSISAGFITIFVIIQIVKAIIDIFLRGYTLHAVFGWSTRILGALFGSLAYLFTSVKLNDPSFPRPTPAPAPRANVQDTIIELEPLQPARMNEPLAVLPAQNQNLFFCKPTHSRTPNPPPHRPELPPPPFFTWEV